MTAILTPKTYNSHAICDGSIYRAKFLASSPIGESYGASPTMVQLPGGFQQTTGMDYGARTIPLLVELLTPTQAYREQLYKWFAPQDAEVTLIATDESSVDRRIAVRCLRLVPYENWKNAFVAILQADNPLWEKDTATTSEHLHCAGDSHDVSIANNGSAPAKPKITVKFNAAKKQAGGPAFFRYRCLPNISTNALTDPDGEGFPTLVKSGLDTATLIKNTAIYNLLNGAIDASVTTITIDGAVGGGLPTTPGMAMVGTEQVYYAANSGTQLTGCVRGIGGTTAATHADNTPIYASKALANGNDLRVWVDGCEVDRWFGTGTKDWNQATTNIWANIPWVARRYNYLTTAMTAGAPADGGSVEFLNDISTWPAAGYFYLLDSPSEIISYSSRIGKTIYGIKRAQKGTSAGTHITAIPVYVVEHDIRYSYGDAGAGVPPADANLKPMIDLAVSTWTKQAWPAAYRADATLRSAQWQQGYENANALCVKLRGFEDASKMQVEDALPEAGKPNRNTWSIALPTGCTKIHHDVSVPANMLLQVWGDDGEALKLLKEYTPDNDGDGEEITPAATIYGLQYRALVRTVTASEGAASYYKTLGDSATAKAQRFTLNQETAIWGFSVQLAKTAGADGNVRAQIRSCSTTDLDVNELFWDQVLCAAADLSTSYAEITEWFTAPVVLPAGSTYYLILYRESGPTAEVRWAYTFPGPYAKGEARADNGSAWVIDSGNDFWFRIFGDGSVCQDEVPSGSGEEVTIDDIELTLTTPFPTITSLSEKSCYLWEALLTLTHADATVQTLSLLVLGEVLDEMEIDCAAQTVINKTTGESVAFGITASDKGWLDVISATDSLTYAEVGMTDTNVTVVLRDTYAA